MILLQGRVKFPLGGKPRELQRAGLGAIPKATVKAG